MAHDGLTGRFWRRKRNWDKYIKNKICPRCSRKPKGDKIYCEYHLLKYKEYRNSSKRNCENSLE